MGCLVTLGVKSSIAMSSLCFLIAFYTWQDGTKASNPERTNDTDKTGISKALFCQAERQRKWWLKKIIILAILVLFSQASVENLHLIVSIGLSRELNFHCPHGRNRWSNSLTKIVSANLKSELSFSLQMTLNKAVGAGVSQHSTFPQP